MAYSGRPRLSSLQLRALTVIRRSPGINLTRLAEVTGTAVPATSRLCDRLEAGGLLNRGRNVENRREVGLILTPQGHESIAYLFSRRAAALREVLRAMPAERRHCLLVGLRAFTEAAECTDRFS
ncbi:MarR family winged helix-turn-helix transcriptional regulator [Streptomyces sp. NPDC058623]|uniref:MarR family winged helix-turn-helix transcriptional regulator n=1 Tax=Streptomyces sp. NPDC058623 TaxID=3346563 RepID=UPI0036556C57